MTSLTVTGDMVYTVEPRLVLTMRLHLYDDSNLDKVN